MQAATHDSQLWHKREKVVIKSLDIDVKHGDIHVRS